MTLKEAIEKFESGRTSSYDYMCISYDDPTTKWDNYHSINGPDIKKCHDADVVKYEEFEGHCMDFSLETMKFSPDHKCRAVSIKVDPDQAEIALHGLSRYPKPKRRHKQK